jgi:hypothetical protein
MAIGEIPKKWAEGVEETLTVRRRGTTDSNGEDWKVKDIREGMCSHTRVAQSGPTLPGSAPFSMKVN